MTASTDPSRELTIAELDAGCRLIKADMLTALTTDSPNRVAALAVSAWLLARRTDRSAQLNTYRGMTITQLRAELGDVDDPSDEPMTVTDRQLAAAAVELGVDFTDLATALQLDAGDPVVDHQVDDVVDPEAPAEPVDPELEQLVTDPTDPAPEPSSPGPGEPTP
jgi:hypothetical protein